MENKDENSSRSQRLLCTSVGIGETIYNLGFLLYSILLKCLYTSLSVRFDHTRIHFLEGLFERLSDEALTYPGNVTATGALDGSAVPEADDLPAALGEFSPMHTAPSRCAPEVMADGDGTHAWELFGR